MGKNWLIRTKSNHILGPVSKEKVYELYQNGSIKQDDEICSGNGYWFFIRESDLVERYLLSSNVQSFNPISEAKDVLTHSGASSYEPTRDDITVIGGIDISKVKEAAAAKPIASTPAHHIESDGSQKKKTRSESQVKHSDTPHKQAQQNYFKYLGLFVFILLVLAIYFRKSILKSFFTTEAFFRHTSTLIISEAHAQNDSSGKKKSF
jgi:hypothetical protein